MYRWPSAVTYCVELCPRLNEGDTLSCRFDIGRAVSVSVIDRPYDLSRLPSRWPDKTAEKFFRSSLPILPSHAQKSGVRTTGPPRVSRSSNAPGVRYTDTSGCQ